MSKKRNNRYKKKNIKLNFVWLFLLVVLIAFVAYFVISGKAKQLYDKLYPDNSGNEVIVNGKTVTFSTEDNDLNVTFIELLNNDGSGSIGDSIFIQCGDVDVLIDAGTKSSGIATVVPFLESKIKDNILELAICTHPDSDHIGGFVGNKKSSSSMDYNGVLFMNEMTISYLVDFGYESDTVVYDAYKKQVDTLVSKGMKYIPIQNVFNDSTTSQEPSIFNLGLNTKLTLLDYLTYKDSTIKDDNDRSVCCLVESSDKKFLLTGDAEVKEEAILSNLEIGHVDVFKSNHHGSPTANSKGLLDAITPDYIVITSSATNSYFLPKKKIVQRLYSYTDKTYATFLDGNITFNCKKGVINVSSTKATLTNILTSSWYLADDEKNPR